MSTDMAEPNAGGRRRLPPKWIPVLYLAYAHGCLVAAVLTLVLHPHLLAEYYYQPRTIALVHLVTLGWITCTILGALYLVGPLAFRRVIPATRIDGLAFALVSVGVAGMVAHFWINAYSGMLWAAATLLIGLGIVAGRVSHALWHANLALGYRAPVILGLANLLLAGSFAVMIGLEKLGLVVVPGFVLDGVHAHAHLAGLGWAGMLTLGVGYRLLPMMLPSAIPAAGRVLATTIVLQAGTLMLALGLIAGHGWAWPGALAAVAGIGMFAYDVRWMLRNRKRPPRALRRPDLGTLHALQAIGYLAVAAGLSTVLLAMPSSAMMLRLSAVYGVFALVGFLSQIIVGVGSRLLPLVAWTRAFVDSGFEPPGTSQFEMPDRRVQVVAFVAWSVGVPGLATATFFANPTAISAAAAVLLAGVSADAINRIRILRHARVNHAAQGRPERPVD